MEKISQDHWPRWLVEVDQALSTRPQFVLAGNIHDVHLVPTNDGVMEKSTAGSLWELLSSRGFSYLIVCNPIEGFEIYPRDSYDHVRNKLPKLELPETFPNMVIPEQIRDWIAEITSTSDTSIALVIDYASRLAPNPTHLDASQNNFFGACLRYSHVAEELHAPRTGNPPTYNSVFWVVDRIQDLPPWFIVGNDRIYSITIPLPDRQTRFNAARLIVKRFPNFRQIESSKCEELINQFADLTDGLKICALKDISALALRQDIDLTEIVDAVRCYKVGIPDNPWKQQYLRDRVRNGEHTISNKINGQSIAVRKALDILTRSIMGLSGAQASSTGGRPRGVLFFAGPTGVGKTELAKEITRLIFSDEKAYVRFDMSEFSSEHSEARLIGAPPGYIGHDAGGELVNAVRQKPFSVILFDEIEKAHPRILDKFLQILEDGRLTDGRGETVFFSEAVLIFTSNLGIYLRENDGSRRLNVSPDEPFNVVHDRIKLAIENHFRFELQRPELLNRIGDNIVVFDFIRQKVAVRIFDKMLSNILSRVREEHGVTIEVQNDAKLFLQKECCSDLSHGGRGIGNRLETAFINPLARTMFDQSLVYGSRMEVIDILSKEGIYEVRLR